MHDTRLGRFFAVDPLASAFPHNSPYAFSENIVINAVELEDLDEVQVLPSSPAKQEKPKSKGYEWMSGASMKNFFGSSPSLGREGKGVFYTDKTNPYYEDWMKGRANHKALEGFIAGYAGASLAAPFIISGAVTSAPIWTPYISMGANSSMQMARAYHFTFGVNGGYANMAWNYSYQSFSTGNFGLGNKDLISLGLSSFTKSSTSILNQSLMGGTGAIVQYTPNNGLVVLSGSNAYIIGSAVNGVLMPKFSNSKYGNNLSGTFLFGTSQLIFNLIEKGEKFDK